MKAITLHMPWDWVMSDLSLGDKLKVIENRFKKPGIVSCQRIALHAGKHYDYDAAELIKRVLGVASIPDREPGVIVATTLIVGWVEKGQHGKPTSSDKPGLVEIAEASPWFFGRYGWVCEIGRASCRERG